MICCSETELFTSRDSFEGYTTMVLSPSYIVPPSLPPSLPPPFSSQMERSPLITWTFHLRAEAILLLLAAIDILYMYHSWNSLRTRGASVLIVFGLEVR